MIIRNLNNYDTKSISIKRLYDLLMLMMFKCKKLKEKQQLLINWLPNIYILEFIYDGENSKTIIYFKETDSNCNLSKIELGYIGLEYQFELYMNNK